MFSSCKITLYNEKFCLSDEVWYFYWGTETGKHMKRNSKSFIFFNLQNSGKRCCKDNVIDPKR